MEYLLAHRPSLILGSFHFVVCTFSFRNYFLKPLRCFYIMEDAHDEFARPLSFELESDHHSLRQLTPPVVSFSHKQVMELLS